MCLVSAVLGKVMLTGVLCCWASPYADSSTDKKSFAEAHLAVVDGHVPHTAHIGLSGGNVLWQEKIWKQKEHYNMWLLQCCVCVTGEKVEKLCSDIPGAPPMNTGFLPSMELVLSGPTTWLTSEPTFSWITLASLITEIMQHIMQQFSSKALLNLWSAKSAKDWLFLYWDQRIVTLDSCALTLAITVYP